MSVDAIELVRDVCGDDVDVAKEVLQSARKEVGELEKIVDEMDLKSEQDQKPNDIAVRQVITTEKELRF